MPVGTLTAIAASSLAPRSGRPERALEHRRVVDAARGLFCLADASGPAAYPGYHPALGIDLGLEAFVAAFAATTATGPSRLLEAFRAAHEEMSRRRAAHPPGALGHFAASITACAFAAGTITVGQVGDCRAYRRRRQLDRVVVDVLVREHTLATAAPHHVAAMLAPDQAAAVVTRVVGEGFELQVDTTTAPVRPGESYAICSRALWPSIDDVFAAPTEAALATVTARCATCAGLDASAIVIEVAA